MAKSTKPKSLPYGQTGATSYKETSLGILSRSKVVQLEAEGIKNALDFIIKSSNQNAKVTPQLILDIHNVGFGFIFPDWAGRFRTIDVIVGDYEPPHYSQIPELITNLCSDLAERLKHLASHEKEEEFLAGIISLLAWFQHRFVWIHPFNDYNGRVARLITNLLLLNLDLPITTIKAGTEEDRKNYIEGMKQADKHDFSLLENLITNALKESLEKI